MICTDEMPDFCQARVIVAVAMAQLRIGYFRIKTHGTKLVYNLPIRSCLKMAILQIKNGGEKRICTTSDHWKSYIRLILREKTGMLLDMKQSLGTY